MTSIEQICLFPKRPHPSRSALHAAQRSARKGAELREVLGAEVGQLMVLPMSPHRLDRVELRRIRRQVLQHDVPVLSIDVVFDEVAAVRGQAIPDDEQRLAELAPEVSEERHDLRPTDGAGKEPEVEVPPGHARHRRKALPVEVVLQHRCLAATRPGATTMGPFAQPALIDEDDRAPLREGVFLGPASGGASTAGWRPHHAQAPAPWGAGSSNRAG